MPLGLVNDGDLREMSSVTFDQFNKACNIFNPEERFGKQCQQYSACIENINVDFKYPHYYNCLIAILLLFSNDDSYDLYDNFRILQIFQETKELAIMGYDSVSGVDICSLNKLIFTLGEMSDIFKAHHISYQGAIIKPIPKTISTLGCFEDKNGIKTQIKPVDCSMENSKENQEYGIMDLYQQIPITDTLYFNEYTEVMYKKFEIAFGSVTSAFNITAAIGKIIFHNFLLFVISNQSVLELLH